jgi:hypothetical protein
MQYLTTEIRLINGAGMTLNPDEAKLLLKSFDHFA